MVEHIEKEVIELHDFFTGWLRGEVPYSDTVFTRVEQTMAEEFIVVNPDGSISTRDHLLEAVRTGHGSRPNWRMWVEHIRLHLKTDTVFVVSYEEWHERNGEKTGRIATAILQTDPNTPNGLMWYYVHETAL